MYFFFQDNTEKLIPYFILLSNYNKMTTIHNISTNDYIPELSKLAPLLIMNSIKPMEINN